MSIYNIYDIYRIISNAVSIHCFGDFIHGSICEFHKGIDSIPIVYGDYDIELFYDVICGARYDCVEWIDESGVWNIYRAGLADI